MKKIGISTVVILVTAVVAYAECPVPGATIVEDLENVDMWFGAEFEDESGQKSVDVDVHFYDGHPEDEQTGQWVTLKFRKRK